MTCYRHKGTVGIEKAIGEFYNGNPKLPVYSYHPTRLDTQEIVNALLDNELKDNMLCSVQPTNVENNVVFVVDLGKLETTKDLYCDDMGSWKHNGVHHSWVEVDDLGFVTSHGKLKPPSAANVYRLTKKYFTHKTSLDLKKTAAFLGGEYGQCTLL